MAKFVNNYPEYRKMQGNVSKHVMLVTEMSRIVDERKLMLVSQTEQDLACNSGQAAALEEVTNLLNNESVSDIDRFRLVLLYALRYEKDSPVHLMQLCNKLSRTAKYKPGVGAYSILESYCYYFIIIFFTVYFSWKTNKLDFSCAGVACAISTKASWCG